MPHWLNAAYVTVEVPARPLAASHHVGEVLAGLELPEGVDAQGYHLHPVLLDGAFQSLIASVDEGPREDLIPVAIDRIHYIGGPATASRKRLIGQPSSIATAGSFRPTRTG